MKIVIQQTLKMSTMTPTKLPYRNKPVANQIQTKEFKSNYPPLRLVVTSQSGNSH